jgi:hypothetical protein
MRAVVGWASTTPSPTTLIPVAAAGAGEGAF